MGSHGWGNHLRIEQSLFSSRWIDALSSNLGRSYPGHTTAAVPAVDAARRPDSHHRTRGHPEKHREIAEGWGRSDIVPRLAVMR
jgi:hypothetical protein